MSDSNLNPNNSLNNVIFTRDTICALVDIALQAGREIMRHYHDGVVAETKADNSLVTIADRAAETLLTDGLRAYFGDIQIIGEEACAEALPSHIEEAFFLLDPLDGTRSFVAHNPDFTVNIAFIRERVPVFGVIYAPAHEALYYGGAHTHDKAKAAYFCKIAPEQPFDIDAATPIRTRGFDVKDMVILASKNHRAAQTDAFIADMDIKDFMAIGSSYKFCMLASGKADLYPRHSDTMEWDIAAGHAILEAAGGGIRKLDGEPLIYGKLDEKLKSPYFIAASNGWWATQS